MITTILTLSGLLGAAAAVAKLYFGIQVFSVAGRIVRWLTEKPEGRVVLIAGIVVLSSWALFDWGRNYERSLWVAKGHQAEIRRLQAENKRLEGERQIAHDRAEYAAAVLKERDRQQVVADEEIRRLETALAAAKLQSTKGGAKHDPKAYLDDRGRYTPLGARSVRPTGTSDR